MLPSPSLGPPLLSESWSPPSPCWMGFGGGAGVVAAGGGDAGGWVVGGAGGWVVGGAGGWVVGGTDGLADGLADGLTECVVAVGLGTEEWAAAAVLQPAVNAAS